VPETAIEAAVPPTRVVTMGATAAVAEEKTAVGMARWPAESRGPGCRWPRPTTRTITGTVLNLERELMIETEESLMSLHIGPPWYWEEEGIDLDPGDTVVIAGFFDQESFEVGRIENLNSGESVTMRDETGRPLWAGRGRQG